MGHMGPIFSDLICTTRVLVLRYLKRFSSSPQRPFDMRQRAITKSASCIAFLYSLAIDVK